MRHLTLSSPFGGDCSAYYIAHDEVVPIEAEESFSRQKRREKCDCCETNTNKKTYS